MSTTAATVINAIPGIEGMRYLELGTCGGGTFDRVRARAKVGVDIASYPPFEPTHIMSTDAFFSGPGRVETFDVVFIDARHEYGNVLRDFNNSVSRLRPGGIVFLHDLVPPSAWHTDPNQCGDAYRLLVQLAGRPAACELCVQRGDFGLTAARPREPLEIPAGPEVTFEAFEEFLLSIDRVTLGEQCATVSRWSGA